MIRSNLYQTNFFRTSPDVTFGDVLYPPGGFCGPRIQQDFQLVVVYSGEAHVAIDGGELHMPAQHVGLFLPRRRELFRFAVGQTTHHSWCAVAPSAIPEPLQTRLLAVPACQPLTARMNELVGLGLSTPASDGAIANDLLASLGLALLQAYVFDAEYTQMRNRTPNPVFRAQQSIDEHLGEPLDLARIAQVANVTPQHLSRLFQRHLQTTPMRYLWQRRTERGVELLRETGLLIGEIAEQVGFQSPFHFSRLVRQRYGHSPRQLREQLWSGEITAESRSRESND